MPMPTGIHCGRYAPHWVPVRSSSDRIVRGKTARWSDSTAPCRRNGPTARSSPAMLSGQRHLRPGLTTTTLSDATARSADSHPSADCHQPDGRVQLAADEQPGKTLLGFAPCEQRPATRAATYWRSLPWVIALSPMCTVVADAFPCAVAVNPLTC